MPPEGVLPVCPHLSWGSAAWGFRKAQAVLLSAHPQPPWQVSSKLGSNPPFLHMFPQSRVFAQTLSVLLLMTDADRGQQATANRCAASDQPSAPMTGWEFRRGWPDKNPSGLGASLGSAFPSNEHELLEPCPLSRPCPRPVGFANSPRILEPGSDRPCMVASAGSHSQPRAPQGSNHQTARLSIQPRGSPTVASGPAAPLFLEIR